MTFLHAQSTSEETTTITITNARQTTYEKNKKEKDDQESSEDSQDSIVLEGSAVGVFKADSDTFSYGTWTGSAKSVKLTATGTGKINTITVTYE